MHKKVLTSYTNVTNTIIIIIANMIIIIIYIQPTIPYTLLTDLDLFLLFNIFKIYSTFHTKTFKNNI